VQQGGDIRPARRNVSTGQSIQVLPFCGVPTVGNKVNFHEPGSFLIPIGEGADWHLLFEQAPRFGGSQTMRRLNADRVQAAINTG